MRQSGALLACFLWGTGWTLVEAADPRYEVQLKRAFMERYKDRTSIDAAMVIRHSHTAANKVGKGSDDGDLHFSGESKDVGLPFVAEVVNASQEQPAVDLIRAAAKDKQDHPSAQTVTRVYGAWRLWFEHPSTSQIQGASNPFHPDTTNPDHSFEIHPIAKVGEIDLHRSFFTVKDFKANPPKDFVAYDAAKAFSYFDGKSITIKASSSGVALRSQKLVYNYVQFVIQVSKKPLKVSDGYLVLAQVLDEEGEPQSSSERRMVFVEGTDPARSIGAAQAGDRFHVLGVPRIDLSAVSALVKKNGTKMFQAALPYEMIIVGIYSQ